MNDLKGVADERRRGGGKKGYLEEGRCKENLKERREEK